MEPQSRLETLFMAIEDNDRKAMRLRTLLKTFLHLEPPAEEHRFRPWGLEPGPHLYID